VYATRLKKKAQQKEGFSHRNAENEGRKTPSQQDF